jgi:transglutaminase-like putative cysteine protease
VEVSSEGRARVGLSILLLVTLFSFAQVFAEGDYPGPVLLGMIVASGLAIAARRLGLGTTTTIALSGLVLFLYLVMIFQARNSFYLLPSPDAVTGLGRSIGNALDHSSLDFAPVPVRTGYVVLVVIGMWLATTVGEVATFRWRRPLLAAVPCIGMFCIQMTVGTGTGAPILVIAFLLALLTYWGLESAHRVRSWGRWVSAFPARDGRPAAGKEPESVTGALARRMGAGCVAAAVVAPMIVPALGDGILAWRNEIGNSPFASGDGSGEINPFVSIAPRLIEQSDSVLFTVQSDEAEYWRLLTLADFDGEQWAPLPASEPVPLTDGEAFPRESNSPSDSVEVKQEFTFAALDSSQLPAALNPVEVDLDEEASVTYDDENQELTVDNQAEEGFSYRVVSNVPDLTFAELRKAEVAFAGSVYEALPPDISPDVTQLAADLRTNRSGGRLSDADFLIGLQDHLRSFDYNVTPEDAELAASGGSVDFLERFLFETKRGYCQQFATAFAMLARVQGMSTRVAVGFLPGERQGDEFVVSGLHTHAWPEVYFEGYGWVRFDPTPRLEAPEPRYTREPVDLGALDGNGPADGLGAATGRQPQGTDPRLLGANDRANTGGDRPAGTAIDDRPVAADPVWERAFNRIALAVALGLLAFLASVPALKNWRIRRRYRLAEGADAAAAAAFAHFEDEAAELAVPRGPAESAASYASRLAGLRKVPADDAARLASIYEEAEYAPSGVRADQARQAKVLARKLRAALWSRASWWARAARLFSPRRLVGRA